MQQFNLKFYCVGGAQNLTNWMRGQNVSSIEKADVVVFPGGADINPALYGEKAHTFTRMDMSLDVRDNAMFDQAMALGKRMVGICRGAQFLCAKAGGKLVQDQANMAYHHPIYTYDGKVILVSSSHHQAMYPWKMKAGEYQVLGWGLGTSKYHDGCCVGDEMVNGIAPLDMEVEVAFFKGINALCIQGHPEWQYATKHADAQFHDTIEYFRKLMDRFVAGDQFENSQNAYSLTS